MSEHTLPKIGISIGDVNGIGMEVIIKSMLDNRIFQLCTPIVYGSSKVSSFHRKLLNINDFSFNIIKSPEQAGLKNANMINVWNEEVNIEIGHDNSTGGIYALKSLEAAMADLKHGKIDALVTAPLNKHNIKLSDNNHFSGHTEFLAGYFSSDNFLMMLVSENIKVATLSGHIPLKDVASKITKEQIIKKAKLLIQSLQVDFNVRKPKIAVLGLNPHAGDNGLLGNEEKEIIIPAIQKLKDEGFFVFGPFAADGFFGAMQYKSFDAVLAMYHDQALIGFKSIAFEDGVNYTAGLPVVRTSPDHGTAYDIAGKNKANEQSFRSAVYLAVEIFKNRNMMAELTANPLKITQQKRER